jgi:hypothetical protein
MVWSDVEGSEVEMLAGMSAVLASAPPLVLEFLATQFDAAAILLDKSYRYFFDLKNGTQQALDSLPALVCGDTDLLFL